MKTNTTDGYNGPDREAFFDTLATYEEHRFNIARETSLAGKVLEKWEKSGGARDDLRDGYKLRNMDVEDAKIELRRQFRVGGWLGLVDSDRAGQSSFLKVFDVKEQPPIGIGGAPLGHRLSIGRAKSAGFNDGKHRNGPTLGEGIELYGFEPDSDEALTYAEWFGEGLKQRPPPKVKKGDETEQDNDEPQPMSALEVMTATMVEMDQQEAAAKPKRGRPRKVVAANDQPPVLSDEAWENGAVPRMVN